MQKRTLIIGDYSTAAHGWTLTSIVLSDPDPKLNYVEKTSGDGSWDLTTALTNGIVRYRDRTLTATLECSIGSRVDRERIIRDLVNNFDGLEKKIIHPDRPEHYLFGRVRVAVTLHGPAYAEVTVTATVQPWFYASRETTVEQEFTYEMQPQNLLLYNSGRRVVTPTLTVTGSASLSFRNQHVQLTDGTYDWPGFMLSPGRNELTYSGNGKLLITYREAVLR